MGKRAAWAAQHLTTGRIPLRRGDRSALLFGSWACWGYGVLRAIFLFSAFALLGCSPALNEARNDPETVIIRDPKQRPVAITQIAQERLTPALSDALPFSLMVAASYQDDPKTLRGLCDQPSIHADQWSRDHAFSETAFPAVAPKPLAAKIPGLRYTVWVEGSPAQHRRVAIIFRGTDFRQAGDWYTNLRWVTRFVPFTWDQYQQTRDLIAPLVQALQMKYGDDVQIIAAGHSLGGGLAQHAAYSSASIQQVYAFASSPVTGSSSLDWRIDRSDVYILRIYESGEILSLLRWLQRRFLPLSRANPQISEARFNFRKSLGAPGRGETPFSQHRAQQMACDLVCHVENGGSSALCTDN